MFVPTKSSQFRSSVPYQEVAFESYKKNSHDQQKPKVKTMEPAKEKTDEVSIKKLRLDVMKFATTGFTRRKQKVAKEAILVELGAKPAPKKYHNYKDLKVMRKRRIQEISKRDEILEKCKQPALTKKISRKTSNNKKLSTSKKGKDDNILGKWGSVKK
ncbi:unnamed protein product [Bemisia tabaci]|uniref:Uncharacterized protein n=1 Tax=Bemisia tabaci TaxID=7038 RepID=A0A9N9ZWL0_BEMTA|nr:unnamed protein product [Bemisia tabaci]